MFKITQTACSEYSVFGDRDANGLPSYLGFVYAVRPRRWANVFTANREWIASVCGPDKIQDGAKIIAQHHA
mgnify:CR=1 FL=1